MTATVQTTHPNPAVSANSVTSWLNRPRSMGKIVGFGLAGGLLTRWAFAGELGFGFWVWTAFLIAAYAAIGGREAVQRSTPALAWAGAALFFATMVTVRDAPALTALNVAATVCLLLLAAHDAIGTPRRTRLLEFAGTIADAAGSSVKGSMAVGRDVTAQARRLDGKAAGTTAAVARGLLIAAPIVLALGGLLIVGDARFGSAVSALTENLPDHLATATDWAFCTLVAGLLVSGGLHFALRRAGALAGRAAPTGVRQIGPTEGLIVLGSVALLFATFLAVIAGYLFDQDPSQRGNGLTYARYAVDGFNELSIVAGLTWVLVESARRRVAVRTPAHDASVRVASSVVLALALVILISAHLRLALYEEVYGFTVRRIFGHAIIAFLGLGLFARLATLWVGRDLCANLVVASAVAVLSALNVLNPDAVVVKANLSRPQQVVSVDWNYLATLSADAAPALSAASKNEDQQYALAPFVRRMAANGEQAGLSSWNFSRWSAHLTYALDD